MNTGKIIPIAFPDTFVRYSDEKIVHYFFPLLGLGRKKYIKAGHALLLLINNETGIIKYFDFGRYVTPKGKGRVRSEKTDVELHIPFKAKISSKSSQIENLEEILLWLEAHPEKTHGEGRMIASVCHEVNYEKAHSFLLKLQNQGSIPYLAFAREGSNCSRLVSGTLIHSSTDKKIVSVLNRNNKFTPSPLGNVKYGANKGSIFEVFKGEIKKYKDSILKENLTNYFDSHIPETKTKNQCEVLPNLHFLEGIGASAYFKLSTTDLKDIYNIERFTECLKKDFEGKFQINNSNFNILKPYKFVYDSNCNHCHVEQKGIIYKFSIVL